MFKIPNVTFTNGRSCPILGLGTWKSKPGEVGQAVQDAISLGCRHLDCAHLYGNEKEVGDGIRAALKGGTLKTRSDLFVTSKLWGTSMRPDLVEAALKATLQKLGLDYLDLYLIHAPCALKEGEDLLPTDAQGNIQLANEIDYLDTWKTMEQCYQKGLTKSIGVSNFNKDQLKRILDNAKIRPVTNQIESHPYLDQTKLQEFCSKNKVIVTAYSPLGSPDRPWAKPDDPQDLLQHPLLKKLSLKYGKSPAQILIKYQVQQGHITVFKSVTKERIREDLDIWDFELDPSDLEMIRKLDCKLRCYPFIHAAAHKDYPFNADF